MRWLAVAACLSSVIPLYGQSRSTNDLTSASTLSGPTDATRKQPSALTDSDANELLTKPIPHPFVSIGPSLIGAGCAPLAWSVKTGLDVESTLGFSSPRLPTILDAK
jgi:hypothetical protein